MANLQISFRVSDESLILKEIENRRDNDPSINPREVFEALIKENHELVKVDKRNREILQRLDLILDILNSIIIEKEIHAIYPLELRTSSMVNTLLSMQKDLN
ncbi:MAG: hypothetical protein LBV67_10470 [Streptococcaceae bacterium]|jgi:hypothetical protein|nr:hypothetical protein [Streptococcaceae bacterium]